MSELASLWNPDQWPGVPRTIDIPEEEIGAALDRAAARWPNRVAVDFMGAATTYRELADSVSRGAGLLAERGIGKGDRVAIALPNCTSHVVAFYAVLRLGAIVVEINPTLSASEIDAEMADSGAVLLLGWEHVIARLGESLADAPYAAIAVDLSADLPAVKRLALRLPISKARHTRAQMCSDALPEIPRWHRVLRSATAIDPEHPRPNPTDLALFQYTGGTTGTPKAAMLTHRNIVSNAAMGAAWTGAEPGTEVVYSVLPFFHAFGMMLSLVYSVRIGATIVAFPKFAPSDVIADAEAPAGHVPARRPSDARQDRRRGRAHGRRPQLRSRDPSRGPCPCPIETAQRWEAVTGGMVVEGYGMTEASPVIAGNPVSDLRVAGDPRHPLPQHRDPGGGPGGPQRRRSRWGSRASYWLEGRRSSRGTGTDRRRRRRNCFLAAGSAPATSCRWIRAATSCWSIGSRRSSSREASTSTRPRSRITSARCPACATSPSSASPADAWERASSPRSCSRPRTSRLSSPPSASGAATKLARYALPGQDRHPARPSAFADRQGSAPRRAGGPDVAPRDVGTASRRGGRATPG